MNATNSSESIDHNGRCFLGTAVLRGLAEDRGALIMNAFFRLLPEPIFAAW